VGKGKEAHGGPDVCSGKQSGFEHVGLTCETNEGEEELLGPLGECAADEGTGAQGGRRQLRRKTRWEFKLKLKLTFP
jgi:hypothetical protein